MTHQGEDDPAGGAAGCAEYYATATELYRAWSPGYNMHFGYFDGRVSPFDREAMLERMNDLVVAHLDLPSETPVRVADLGCGTAATARAVVRAFPQARVTAVTNVPSQARLAAELNRAAGMDGSVQLAVTDYTATGLESQGFDGVYALESACYAEGPYKSPLLAEMARLLAPGGRLVIADGFLRHSRPLPRLVARLYVRWCENWAVPGLADLGGLRAALAGLGFDDVRVLDISWNLAPSIAHIPLLTTRFIVSESIRRRGRLAAWHRRHVLSSALSVLISLCKEHFGYFLVTARRRSGPAWQPTS